MSSRSRTIEVKTTVEIEVVAYCEVEPDGVVNVERVEPSGPGAIRGQKRPDVGDWLDSTTLQTIESEAAMRAAPEFEADRTDELYDRWRDEQLAGGRP